MPVSDLRIPAPDIMVVHDDLERDIGKMSFKSWGSAGGHNGITSCIKYLKTQHFWRLRVGIGRPPFKSRASDVVSEYVLGRFQPSEIEMMELMYERASSEIIRTMTVSSDPFSKW